MADDLLCIAVVTIKARDGREIDITDNRKEYTKRAAAGRLVLTGREVNMLKKAGLKPEKAALLVELKAAAGGGEIEEIGPSSGPYPWDLVRPAQEQEETDGQGKWW